MLKKFLIIIGCVVLTAYAQKPSDILDVTNWKITMPYNTPQHPGNPDEIFQPMLDDFLDTNYYYVHPDGAGVVFSANCGAATTTNSKYPRCEYREMRMDDNTEKASWSTDDGKLHVMEIIQAITHLPEKKPHVVAGQIHDAGDDLTVFRLERKKLFVDLNGDDGPVLTDNYTLGEKFTVKFIAGNGKITYEYNGEPVRDNNGDIFELNCGNVKGCYFKAGCYTQSNIEQGDEPDAYGEVVIYSFFVSHGNEIHTHHTNTPIIPSVSSVNTLFRMTVKNGVMRLGFSVNEPQPVTITIMNLRGALILKRQFTTKNTGSYHKSISLKSFPSGIYLAKMMIDNISFTDQFILMQ